MRLGVNTLASIAFCRFLVRQSTARSIECLSFVGGMGELGKLVRMVLYFDQLMKRLVVGGDDEIGVHRVSRSIGLWSEDSSLRFSMWVGYGRRARAMSSTSGL